MAQILFALLVLLQLADIATTIYALRHGGREANPIMARVIERLGLVGGLLLPKVAVVLLAYLYLLPYPAMLALLSGLYVGIVIHNGKVIWLLR